jgi:diguanylate cyclase (GGDEF)-like protein/PAS domain S-box-containing protein
MWSTNTVKNMCTAEGKGQHYAVDKAGVWVECIYTRAPTIHNDYASLPASRRKGMPEGHATVIREMVVPVIRGDLIVSIVGLGNKPANYNDEDVKVVLELANLTWDIVQRKRAEELLKESEWRNRIVSELTADYIFVVDVDLRGILKLRWASDNMFRMTGRTIKDVATSDLWGNIIHPDDAARFFNFINQTISTAKAGELECRTFYKHGGERWIHIFARPQVDEENRVITIVGAIDDITERKQAEKALETANIELQASLTREQQLAHTDMLTGVNNRRYLYVLAAHEFDIATRYHQPLSILMLDLDHFKQVNDTFGHAIGDQMLKLVTQTACTKLRSTDAIGRYGGEEFVVLLPMTTAQQAFSLAERIRESVAQVRVPTPVGEAAVTLSIGIVEITQKSEQTKSVDDLIRRADQAMYIAKQSGRNRTEIIK